MLLIRPNGSQLTLGPASRAIKSSSPPLGLLYIASFLKKRGVVVDIIDNDVERSSFSELSLRIANFQPDFIGITTVSASFSRVLDLATLCKRLSKAKIILGGPHVSGLHREVLEQNQNFDMVIRGEGEKSFLDLIEGYDLDSISGLSYRKGNIVFCSSNLRRIENLDELPFPDFNILKLSNYKDPIYNMYGNPVIPIITTRGCPFDCIFCASGTIFGHKVVKRTVGNVIEEIKGRVKKHPKCVIRFFDDSFTLDKKRVVKLCERLKKIGVKWICSARADNLNFNLLKIMKESGCSLIQIGVESTNEVILENINKKVTFKQIEDSFYWANLLGLDVYSTFIIGLPGDNYESIKNTIKISKKFNSIFTLFLPPVPYPGTKLYEYGREKNLLLFKEWADLDAPKYKNLAMGHLNLSKSEIIYLIKYAYNSFYFRWSYIFKNIIVSSLKQPRRIKYFLNLSSIFIKYFYFKRMN